MMSGKQFTQKYKRDESERILKYNIMQLSAIKLYVHPEDRYNCIQIFLRYSWIILSFSLIYPTVKLKI